MPIPPELIDPDAQKVVRRLVRGKHQAYLVGGCVRDLLLERTPKDFDIATSATPPEIKDLFRNCRIIGRRFRLAHIFFGSKIIETATFRANPREGELLEGAEPGDTEEDLLIRRDNVFGSAEEDARRRDFTINGLFYDLEADQVIDYVGGLADLATRTVRTIGDPQVRFREDPVRILRAIKFAARLDFGIDPAAWRAILAHKGEIPKCPAPRVLEEIYRLLRSGVAVRSFELLRETGVLELLMPEVYAIATAPDGDPARAWLWAALERIDQVVARNGRRVAPPTNAVLLSILVGPMIGVDLFDDESGRPHDVGQLIDDRTRSLLERIRVSRRDSERARQMLLAQRRLSPAKRRRGRPMALVRRDWFEEALAVYEVLAPVMAPSAESIDEELDHWRKIGHDAEHDAPDIEGDASDGEEGDGASFGADAKPRRRRRGGRRRRRGPNGEPIVARTT